MSSYVLPMCVSRAYQNAPLVRALCETQSQNMHFFKLSPSTTVERPGYAYRLRQASKTQGVRESGLE